MNQHHSSTTQKRIKHYLQFKANTIAETQTAQMPSTPFTAAATTSFTVTTHHFINLCKIFINLLSLWMLCSNGFLFAAATGRHFGATSLTPNSTEILYQDILRESNSIPKHTPRTPHEHSRALKRVFLSNRTVVCNDGTFAGFYLRKNANSKKWIVFLEGGWHCYDTRTCRSRWTRLRHLMTSSQWPETRDVGGILSPLPDENPYWHSANHVLVPYCSSDSWSGTKASPDSSALNFRFMGSLILRQVISDLIPLGLGRIGGAELLLAGSSAGGLGVMLNLDRITNFLQNERQLQITVRGVSDSGWFLDREPYAPSAVASSEAVRQGWSMWEGSLPQACVEQHKSEPWRCYFGYRLYPTLKAPLFVFQWLFDEAQMRADNVAAPVTPHQWNYIHAMGGALRSSLDKVDAVFAPSCIGHAVLSKREWLTIKIDDISLPTALRCWEHSTRPRRKRHDKIKHFRDTSLTHLDEEGEIENHRQPLNKKRKQREKRKLRGEQNRKRMSEWERTERKRLRHEQQKQRQEKRNKNRKNLVSSKLTNAVHSAPDNNSTKTQQRRKNKPKHRHDWEKNSHANHLKHKSRNHKIQTNKQKLHELSSASSSSSSSSMSLTQGPLRPLLRESQNTLSSQRKASIKINRRSGVPRVPEKCALRLMERCSWPQCNHSCPTLTNPATGEEMRFLELLASFGLDMEAVATALGVDMQTLNNMDRTELVNLLTQQVS